MEGGDDAAADALPPVADPSRGGISPPSPSAEDAAPGECEKVVSVEPVGGVELSDPLALPVEPAEGYEAAVSLEPIAPDNLLDHACENPPRSPVAVEVCAAVEMNEGEDVAALASYSDAGGQKAVSACEPDSSGAVPKLMDHCGEENCPLVTGTQEDDGHQHFQMQDGVGGDSFMPCDSHEPSPSDQEHEKTRGTMEPEVRGLEAVDQSDKDDRLPAKEAGSENVTGVIEQTSAEGIMPRNPPVTSCSSSDKEAEKMAPLATEDCVDEHEQMTVDGGSGPDDTVRQESLAVLPTSTIGEDEKETAISVPKDVSGRLEPIDELNDDKGPLLVDVKQDGLHEIEQVQYGGSTDDFKPLEYSDTFPFSSDVGDVKTTNTSVLEDANIVSESMYRSHEGNERPVVEAEEGGVPECEPGDDGAADDSMPQEHSVASQSSSGGENAAISEADTAATSAVFSEDDAMEEEAAQIESEETRVEQVKRGGGRRKRGRPGKGQVGRPPVKKKEEEEVCFICFDGGDLVVCDRRGCPKVYHPSCVNRDETFFRAKGRWNCGWHLCSNCERSAHYMCFTCTHSLCKGCIKNTKFVSVRGNKGFCEACMRMVILIETHGQGNEETAGVDFDDRSSWEYLFKDYWLDLKAKQSLTLEELTRAKGLSKGPAVIPHEVGSSDVADSCNSLIQQEESTSSTRKLRKRSRNTLPKEILEESESVRASTSEDINWASDELLEFVAHMKNGDRSVLSQFDVQALLLEYIKRNNLRDPRRKSQIICDARLENIFGKSRVGHFEMLKLLESHFLAKEHSSLDMEENHGGVVDPDPNQKDADENIETPSTMLSHKRQKNRKRNKEMELQSNLDDYAAIDVHNISLMYLRRNLMEELIDDMSSFYDKVVGSFVRIRISGAGQRQDVYRLVQVVGTGKAAERYRSGKKSTDVTLEILNLNKTEVITIDIISNQEFTEEECKRLRQSIKCGFINRLTVGEVQEKARALQVVRVNDWLESEKLRLGHLRDRASETGRRKELRECVEKLQLLSMPEERRRRLNEIPEIHSDPNMDPDYESPEEEEPDYRNKDFRNRARGSSFLRNARESKSFGRGSPISSDNWVSPRSSNIVESKMFVEGAHATESSFRKVDKKDELPFSKGTEVRQATNSDSIKDLTISSGPEISQWKDNHQIAQPGESSLSSAAVTNINVSEKIWHYQDPSGKIQGPFSITQLRKWNGNGYFPSTLRIWRASEKQDDSILLTDALAGNFQKDLPQWEPPQSSSSQLTNVPSVYSHKMEGDVRGSSNSVMTDRKQDDANWKARQHDKLDSQLVTPLSATNPSQTVSHQKGQSGGSNEIWDQRNTGTINKPAGLHFNSQGSQVSHGNWNLSGHLSSGTTWNVQTANDSTNPWGNSTSNLFSPTPQPNSQGWPSIQVASDKFSPSNVHVQSMNPTQVTNPNTDAQQGGGSDHRPVNHVAVGTSGLSSFVAPEASTLQPQVGSLIKDYKEKSHMADMKTLASATSPHTDLQRNPENAQSSNPMSGLVPMSEGVNAGWKPVADHTVTNNQPVQMDVSKSLASSQFVANMSLVPGQQMQTGIFNGTNVDNAGSLVASQNTSAAQGNINAFYASAAQGIHPNTNAGWGLAAQGNTNASMPWGQAAQSLANANMALGTRPQLNMMMNSGWVAPAPGSTNLNMGWLTPALNANQIANWIPQMQGNIALNPGWGLFHQGNTNIFPGWAANPATANQTWEAAAQGNANMGAAWESGQGNANQAGDTSGGSKSWSNQQAQWR